MLEKGYLLNTNVPYGQVTNAERQRRQAIRAICFLEELGVENVTVGESEAEHLFHVSGFVPQHVVEIQTVETLLHDLGAVSTSLTAAITRKRQI